MDIIFDVDPAVADPEILNQKIIQKVNTTIEKVRTESKKNLSDIPEQASIACGYSREELKALRIQMEKIYEQLQKMNSTWDINNHVVLGNNRITKVIKKMIWKVQKKLFKPLVSGISSFNLTATITVSEMIRLLDMIIGDEERRTVQ